MDLEGKKECLVKAPSQMESPTLRIEHIVFGHTPNGPYTQVIWLYQGFLRYRALIGRGGSLRHRIAGFISDVGPSVKIVHPTLPVPLVEYVV